MEFNYDFAQTPPSSGGGKNFPISPEGGWLVQITSEEMRPMKQGQGNMLVFSLQGLEGAVNGVTAESRHNLQHPKQETVQIAMAEISAIAYATGTIAPGNTRLQRTTDMFGKPFRVIVVQQPNSQYTEIVGYRTADGRDPVKIANGSANVPTRGAQGQPAGMSQGQAPQFGQPAQGMQQAPQGQPQFGQQPGQGGFQQQAAPQGGFGQQQQPQGQFGQFGQQPQGQPAFGQQPGQHQQPPQGGGWGQPAQGAPQGQPQWGQQG